MKMKNTQHLIAAALAFAPGTILRLYGPTEAAINKSWKPGDLEKVQ